MASVSYYSVPHPWQETEIGSPSRRERIGRDDRLGVSRRGTVWNVSRKQTGHYPPSNWAGPILTPFPFSVKTEYMIDSSHLLIPIRTGDIHG